VQVKGEAGRVYSVHLLQCSAVQWGTPPAGLRPRLGLPLLYRDQQAGYMAGLNGTL
jgi:hypothetical protein